MGKHQPQEISSKQPVSVLREVIPVEKKRFHDPRFDRNFGSYNSDLFSKSYTFLHQMQSEETKDLEAKLVKEKDPKIKSQLKFLLERRRNRQRSHDKIQKTKKLLKGLHKADLEKVSSGFKRPYFLKKSAQKQVLREQADQENKGKPEAYQAKSLEKKLKRRASKQKKRLPWEN
jgi:ribosomal RNA-processing protein 36